VGATWMREFNGTIRLVVSSSREVREEVLRREYRRLCVDGRERGLVLLGTVPSALAGSSGAEALRDALLNWSLPKPFVVVSDEDLWDARQLVMFAHYGVRCGMWLYMGVTRQTAHEIFLVNDTVGSPAADDACAFMVDPPFVP